MSYTIDPFNELYHHGILGQKWGVRRYQNEDGTLTSAGRERYGKIESRISSGTERGKRLLEKNRTVGGSVARSLARDVAITAAISMGTIAAANIVKSKYGSVFDFNLEFNNGTLTPTIGNGTKAFMGMAAGLSAIKVGALAASRYKGHKDAANIGRAQGSGSRRKKDRYLYDNK